MRTYTGSTAMRRNLAIAIPVGTAAWLVTVPAVFTTSTFVALVGVVAAVGWVARTTYRNAQPASSFAQLMHDADATTSLERKPGNR
jgi:hypothetical protein